MLCRKIPLILACAALLPMFSQPIYAACDVPVIQPILAQGCLCSTDTCPGWSWTYSYFEERRAANPGQAGYTTLTFAPCVVGTKTACTTQWNMWHYWACGAGEVACLIACSSAPTGAGLVACIACVAVFIATCAEPCYLVMCVEDPNSTMDMWDNRCVAYGSQCTGPFDM